jgi:tripartite-type tricarboxylate transporter receptor subunit TctC
MSTTRSLPRGMRSSALVVSCLLVLTACADEGDTVDPQAVDDEEGDGEENGDLEGFPERPIDVVVVWGTGGGSDIFARGFADVLGNYVDVPLAVQNQPGSTGEVGLQAFLDMGDDGHAVVSHSAEYALMNAFGATRTPIDELYLIGRPQLTPSMLYVPTGHDEIETFDDVVAFAEENPGELRVAVTGPGSADDLTVRYLESEGIDLSLVEYPEPGERYSAPLQGDADLLYEQPGTMADFIEAGDYQPIVAFEPEPVEGFEDVPLIGEYGVEVSIPQWRFWALPDSAPDEVKAWWVERMEEAAADEQWTEFSAEQYTDFGEPMFGDELNEWARNEIASYEEMVDAVDVEVELDDE